MYTVQYIHCTTCRLTEVNMVWFTCHVVVVSGDGVSVPDDDAVVACGLSSFGAMFFFTDFYTL